MTKPNRSFAVLVGAGASYGAGHLKPGPPPLGDELYAWLRKLYPGTWGAVTGQLDGEFRKNNDSDGVGSRLSRITCFLSEAYWSRRSEASSWPNYVDAPNSLAGALKADAVSGGLALA